MIAWWWLIPVLLLGALLGVVVMCLMWAAGRGDDGDGDCAGEPRADVDVHDDRVSAEKAKGGKVMGAFVARQPNGLLCRFSTIVDCPTHTNMTAEEYLEMRSGSMDDARDVLKNHIHPFSDVIDSFLPTNMSRRQFNKWLKSVGYKAGKGVTE